MAGSRRSEAGEPARPAERRRAQIKVRRDGPYKVTGDIELVDGNGEPLELPGGSRDIVLCRCGASGSKPFCDQSHRRVGWSDNGPR